MAASNIHQAMTFADQLKSKRSALSLSQSQAAKQLVQAGIIASLRTLQNWEQERNQPHEVVQKVAIQTLKKI